MKRGTMFAAIAALCVALAPTPSWAAKYWTGNTSGNWQTSGNWNGTSGRRYFMKGQLKGNKSDLIYLSANVTESSNTGLCFAEVPNRGYWRLHGTVDGTTYTFDNSGNTGNYDQDLICIGYSGTGSSARFYGITLKTRHLTIGGHATLGGHNILKSDMTGHLVLDDQNNDANGYLGPVNITTTKSCDFYKGDLYATNANITCQGDMMLYTFTVDKTGGDWTMTGDFKIGLGSGTATVTQRGGTFSVPAGKWTRFESGSTSAINLYGGTFETSRITNQGATSNSVLLDGGTIEVNGDASNYGLLDASVNVRVGSNGGTINAGGRSFHVPPAINAVENTSGAFTVTGGGAVSFQNMGNLTGALNVGDGTTVRWFDQDGTVSATCTFTSLALGAGSTIYIDGNATAVDALPSTVTTTATAGNKATVEVSFSAIPAAGTTFALFPAASADVFDVKPRLGGLELPHEVSLANGNLVLTITAEDYTWNGTQTNWGDADAWTKGGAAATWADGNNAIFGTANATVALAADASAAEARFTADATISGSGTLTVPSVSVAPSVAATISATTAGTLEKTGAGTLTLGASRTDQTTVSGGTLAMANGATVDPAKLTLGSDSSTPVTFDYCGQTLDSPLAAFIKPGADVTLTNGVFSNSGSIHFTKDTFPSVLTVASGASLEFGDHFSLNTTTEATLNIAGGTAKATKNTNNWIMQQSLEGRLNINVTDGGLLEFAGEAYVLTCRDTVNGSTDYQNPSLYLKVVDSTLRVLNSKSLRLGRDDNNKNAVSPTGVFAATNSVIDIGYGMYVGNNVIGANTAGSYTVDFENCTITAREVRVYQDRPLNAIRFNNTRYVVNNNSDYTLESASAFETLGEGGTAIKPITIDVGGLVIDSNGKNCGLQADPQGSGAITKVGSGKLTILRSQSSLAGLICEEGETLLNAGLTVARPVTVESNATFTAKATAQSTISSLTFENGATLNIDTPTVGITPIAVTTLALPANGTVALKKNGGAFGKGLYPIFEKTGITVTDVANLVPETSDLPYDWTVQDNTLVLAVDTDTSGFVWTGLAGDGKMSTGGNWLNGVAPSAAGTDLDFSGVITATTIIGDIDVTFGAVTMGTGVITFSGDKMRAASFSNTRKIAVDADSTVVVAGDLTIDYTEGDGIVSKVDAGGTFIVDGIITITGGSVHPVLNVGDGFIVAGGIVVNSTLYSTKDATSQRWAIGPSGITGQNFIWCLANIANDCWIHPYTNDFTIAVNTVVRSSIDHHELNTTGYGDGLPHTITLDSGFADNGQLYIAGTGKVVVNSVPTATSDKAAYSGRVTVTNTATLAINDGMKLTTGTITFAAGTTLEVPSTGVETGEIAFSGEGTVTLKVVSDASLADGEYTLITSTADLPAGVASRFTVDAQTESRTCLVTLDNRSLRLAVGEDAIAALPCIWTGAAGDGKMDTVGNWLNNRKPETVGAAVLFPSETATIDNNISGFAPSSITFGNGTGSVTLEGNAMTDVIAVTNVSSTASHTINAPVYFAGDIQVKQAAMAEVGNLTNSHVTFAGGAYAALGYSIENGSTSGGYSRCVFGKYYLANAANNPWTATVQGSANRICLADNSLLYIPYAGKMTELYIGSGSKVDIGEMVSDGGRVSYRNNGEVVVTNLTLSGTGDRTMCWNQGTTVSPVFKFERVETSMTGNWLYFSDGSGATKGVYYIGAGGLNFSSASAKGCYCIGRNVDNDAQTLRPWYSDFTIADRGNGEKSLVINRDVTFCTDDEGGTGRTITVDAIVQGQNSPTITVSGSGTLRVNNAAKNSTQPPVTVTNTATLAIKPGASLTTSTTTLNSGTTLEVAESGTVTFGGDLTLKEGATLGFNYTTRDAPVLNLTDKTVTFDEGATTNVLVKITTSGKRGRGGKHALTSGGKFADATVSLAEGYPDWVKGISVNADGNIVIDVKPSGLVVCIK
ncbi:MAG: hypothetical protein J6T51_01210 [Kiritimatiellae bacterium]|nr:hypothetical protein [Kiritimatiellia bacterium]